MPGVALERRAISAATTGGAGLQEVQQPWTDDLDADAVVDHLAAVLDVTVDQLLEVERLGPAVIDGQRVDTEGNLHLRVLIEIVDDDLGDGIALAEDGVRDAAILGGNAARAFKL